MNVVLLRIPQGRAITADMSDFFEDESGCYPPFGLLMLQAACRRPAPTDRVTILDAPAAGLGREATLAELQAQAPDVVGITAITFQLVELYEFLARLKLVLPKTILVLGGPHVYQYPRETMANANVDYAVAGEGEESLPQLLRCIAAGRGWEKVPGLYFRRPDGAIACGPPPTVIARLDDLAPPDYSTVPFRRYHSVLAQGPLAVLLTTRGCPFHCIYCDRPHLGAGYREHSPERVLADVSGIRRLGVRNLYFFDDTFTVNRDRVMAICRLLTEARLGLAFFLRARVNTVDAELLRALRAAGCRRISFGVEAGNDRSLAALRKGTTVAEARLAFRLCREAGIETLADFILGGPGQTPADIDATIGLARELDPAYAQFTVMTPYPGTELYRQGLAQGVLHGDYWREFARVPRADFVTPVWEEQITRAELRARLRQAYRRFYFQPRPLLRELMRLRSPGELWRKARIGVKMLVGAAGRGA